MTNIKVRPHALRLSAMVSRRSSITRTIDINDATSLSNFQSQMPNEKSWSTNCVVDMAKKRTLWTACKKRNDFSTSFWLQVNFCEPWAIPCHTLRNEQTLVVDGRHILAPQVIRLRYRILLIHTTNPEGSMKVLLQPWQLLLLVLAGWLNRQQQEVIEYLVTENRVLRRKLGKKRVLLTDQQRRQLAVKGRVLGRKMLEELALVATSGTILRWHRELVARNWDYGNRRKQMGRPPVPKETADLVLKQAKENPRWGYNRIQGAIRKLGHSISDTAMANILKAHGIDPAPDRKRQSSWKTFPHRHRHVLASVEFTTIGVWTRKGLVTYYLLFFMELATRKVHFAGLTPNPEEGLMLQVARNVTDAEGGFLRGKRYLLMDRDTKFSEAFRGTLEAVGVRPVRLPPRAPNLNAHIERFLRSLKEERLERMIFFGERSLQTATVTYVDHFLTERNHQGMGYQLIIAGNEVSRTVGEIACRERLGGLLRYYYREAA
jgi:putative transposase